MRIFTSSSGEPRCVMHYNGLTMHASGKTHAQWFLFGILGMFFGPLVFSIAIAFLEFYFAKDA
jgi:hypothetical protein